MQKNIQSIAETGLVDSIDRKNFNYNKLQAVLCIAASAVSSIAIIAWAIHTYL
ncbi:hypothetical protein [Janthinobacterium sp. 17J80-10]|uniref:hypothetical protein n=1 Tax=Janthinobacterium sp. 17J80-10 TaxID=2497863 RepID=UPI0013E8B323|nr:hypothetical protein [Janthinobacterium sp. 17J80-10]